MSAGKLDFYIEKGTDWLRTITVKDSDGVAVNITGYTVRGQLRETHDASTKTDFTMTITDGAAGTFTVALTDTVTEGIEYNTGVYDVELVNLSGNVQRLLEGSVSLSDEVTKAT